MKFTAALPLALALQATACLLPEELQAEREYAVNGHRPSRARSFPSHSNRRSTTHPIGKADRFADGTIAPEGLGVNDRQIPSILSAAEVSSGVRGLKAGFPDDVTLFNPPFETVEGRKLQGAVVGKDPRVFLMSGIHARERGGPDHVLYFLSDLLNAKKNGKGLAYGKQTYTKEQVEKALSAGVVVVPLVNPDGVTYDQKTGTCWRKNRNMASSSGNPDGPDVGIDLNRNFDFLWDYKKTFNPDSGNNPPASDDPASEVFYGTSPASEAETKSVAWVMDQYKGLSWFLDLHSFTGSILYAWGDDDAGHDAPEQNFKNTAFDGLRGFTGTDPPDSQYKEFLETADLQAEESLNELMLNAMNKAGSVPYSSQPSVSLYPTSGGSNDYALGRYYGHNCGVSKILGLAVEFGTASGADPGCPFYPSGEEYHNSMRQVGAGLMELLLNAAGPAGEPKFWECKE